MNALGKWVTGLGIVGAGMIAAGIALKPMTVFAGHPEKKNPFEGKKVRFVENESEPANADGRHGHLEAAGTAEEKRSLYDRYWKRGLDIVLSSAGLILLSPLYLVLSAAIVIDDPGPVFFAQKRVGRNKQFFRLHKFRSMKMSTPHDVPTHMLSDPDQYITRVGRFLRRSSLDELPQIGDIFLGNMSVIGPRPALWNQDVLIAERDRYGANDIRPGLTGWAQINGRDELELADKARLDGDYAEKLSRGGWKAFLFDLRCFVGTVFSVVRADGLVEGGTGEMNKQGASR